MGAKPAYSIVGRLSHQLFWQTLIGMGLVCAGIYAATSMFVKAEQSEQLATKVIIFQELIYAAAKKNGETEVVAKLTHYAPRRPGTFLEVWRADGSQLYRDGNDNGVPGEGWRSMDFEASLPQGGVLRGRIAQDCTQLARMLTGLGVTLLFATLAAGRPLAESADGSTRVGFTLAVQ
jgi:two-component system heavy metal sensor histidine kinase CusS